LKSPVFENKIINAQINYLAIQNGWLTKDEVRAEMGLDSLPEDTPEDPNPEDLPDDEKKGSFAKPIALKKRIREKKRPDALVEIMKDILMEETH